MIDSSILYHKQDTKGFSKAGQRKSHVSALTSFAFSFSLRSSLKDYIPLRFTPTSEHLFLFQAFPKYATQANQGCTFFNCNFEIVTHPHRKLGKLFP
jgi:hypothetical protein